MTELLVSLLVYLFIPAIPIYTAWTHPNWKGVLLGAITFWIFFFLGNLFLVTHYGSGEDPGRDTPIGGLITMLWLIIGLPPSAIFCAFVVMIRRFTTKRTSGRAPIPSSEVEKASGIIDKSDRVTGS